MAGIRCGMAIGRPDLLAKLENFSGWSAMPITAMAAATASLKHEHLVPERKQCERRHPPKNIRLARQPGLFLRAVTINCFMLDAKRPAKEVIGRPGQAQRLHWPSLAHLATHVRITVGTQPEMECLPRGLSSCREKLNHDGLRPRAQAPPLLSRRPGMAQRIRKRLKWNRFRKSQTSEG